ncbi:MAG: GNAT family N-acetyltransferase [Spirochaetales bacterium]|nr:GNAT family N-acetyltransferase [Leptospiraceae bacterium]MCP5481133.1 GNAT family N-acetyltransferase [Spirochaetales bacterium]
MQIPTEPEALHRDQVPVDLLLQADPSQERIAGYLERAHFFGLRNEASSGPGRVVAISGLLEIEQKALEIVNLAVEEVWQRRGLGRALLVHAIDFARRANAPFLRICTGNSSVGQLALYQKCGFRMQRICRDFFLKNYAEPIYENGILCADRIVLEYGLRSD